MMYGIGCFNGKFIDYHKLHLHISDLTIQRGYGIFDFFEIIEGEIKWKKDYFERFFNSLTSSGLEIDYKEADIEFLIDQLIDKNQSKNSYIKMMVTGGYSLDGFSYVGPPNFIILNMAAKKKDPELYLYGAGLISEEFIRPNPKVKSLNYFTSAKLQHKMRQYDAVDVLYHFQGIVSETSRANLFIVEGDKIHTPKIGILEGVTRKNVIKFASISYEVEELTLSFERVMAADELFITSTTKGILPVVRIDKIKINNGKVGNITKKLMVGFH